MNRPGPNPGVRPSRVRTVLAWGVHFYTALGLVCASGMAVLIVQESFRWAFILMMIATLIDATDGTLARAVRIKETLPGFDGRKLDDLVDFLNYTFLPLFLLWRTDILPDGQKYWLLLPLLASAYGFCQVSAKTDDGYFLGFPSYWNLVAFYIYVLQPMPAWITLSLVIVPALLTFVPSRYLYPTQPGRLNRLTTLIGAVWAAMLVWILVVLPDKDKYASELPEDWPRLLAVNSLFFPIYYMTVSWAISWRAWRVRRRRAKDPLRAALAAEQPAVR